MGRTHEHEIRVRYGETDQMGVVYHAHYLDYMDEGRTRLMAALGEPYHELEARGWALVVRKIEVRYRSSARFGDVIVVRTWVEELRGASVVFRYAIRHRDEERLLAEGQVELACVSLRGPERKPTSLPAEPRRALAA